MTTRKFKVKNNHLIESLMYKTYKEFCVWFSDVKIYATDEWLCKDDGEIVFCSIKGCEFVQITVGDVIDFKAIVDGKVDKLIPLDSSTFKLTGEPIND